MKAWSVIIAGLLLFSAGLAEAGASGIWEGTWCNRIEDKKADWVLELPDGAGELEGTLKSGQASWPVKARREGAWLEVSWTDAEGRITQARGVIGEGEWRGLTLSGGGGRLIEYGRFALRKKESR